MPAVKPLPALLPTSGGTTRDHRDGAGMHRPHRSRTSNRHLLLAHLERAEVDCEKERNPGHPRAGSRWTGWWVAAAIAAWRGTPARTLSVVPAPAQG